MIKKLLVLALGLHFAPQVLAQDYGIGAFEKLQIVSEKVGMVFDLVDLDRTRQTDEDSKYKNQLVLDRMVRIAMNDAEILSWLNDLIGYLNSETFKKLGEKEQEAQKFQVRYLMTVMVEE